MSYIWEDTTWPRLSFDQTETSRLLEVLEASKSKLLLHLKLVGFQSRQAHFLNSLSNEVVDTSLIENEVFSAQAVRSSIARKLGIDPGAPVSRTEQRAEGMIQVLLEATQNYAQPLTEERIKTWHRQLMSHDQRILAGEYRNDPIYVGSGAIGREAIHFEGPPAERVDQEMKYFCRWLNETTDLLHPWLKSSIAHLWFVTIHPFEDGNGRLARAIAEYFLARADGSAERFYSVSTALNSNRKAYYDALEKAQKGTVDITGWMLWSLNALKDGIDHSTQQVKRTIAHGEIWKRAVEAGMNERQRKMLPKLLEGFEGPLTTRKWAQMCRCSQDSATRDIAAWLVIGILERGASGGRSTHYGLASPE